jgi:hypothetical protein
MNWEEISAISTFITMLVIASSAIAALIQLRHMRAGNAITGFLGFMDRWASPQAREIANYVFSGAVQKKLQDPAYRAELRGVANVDRLVHPEFQYLDFWESIGMFVKLGYFAEDAVMESGGLIAVRAWEVLMPVIAIVRSVRGPEVYDNYEYLVSRAMLWEAKHPGGIFPNHTPRLSVTNSFADDPQVREIMETKR